MLVNKINDHEVVSKSRFTRASGYYHIGYGSCCRLIYSFSLDAAYSKHYRDAGGHCRATDAFLSTCVTAAPHISILATSITIAHQRDVQPCGWLVQKQVSGMQNRLS